MRFLIWSRATTYLYLGKFPNPLADKITNISIMPNKDVYAKIVWFF